ncbi:hypothetical protein F5Y09DRAFT_74419 [Xylaria sp. FL1042]|nr:hypothetical protein F5Y09DRAFT_74419 [Xylaria sp. FL1042]
MSTSSSFAPSSVNKVPARAWLFGSVFQTTMQKIGSESEPLEPGEIPAIETKKEEESPITAPSPAPNPFAKYQWLSTQGPESPFAHASTAVTTAPITHGQSRPAVPAEISRPTTAVQRRNHKRLNEIVTRLQNVDGSVAEILAIANVQQKLDAAFADLDCARSQLGYILRQFETQGHMSERQYIKRNGATRDLTKASQRIANLTQELWILQRREPGSH